MAEKTRSDSTHKVINVIFHTSSESEKKLPLPGHCDDQRGFRLIY